LIHFTTDAMKHQCTKKSFDTPREARDRIKEIKLVVEDRKKPCREYQCRLCGKWHLTSISESEVVQIVSKRRGREIGKAVAVFNTRFKEKTNKVKKFKKDIDRDMKETLTLWQRCEALGPQKEESISLEQVGVNWVIYLNDLRGGHALAAIVQNPSSRKNIHGWLAYMILQRFEAIALKSMPEPVHQRENCARPLTIESVVEWMNTWDQLKHTVIPLRFKEDFEALAAPKAIHAAQPSPDNCKQLFDWVSTMDETRVKGLGLNIEGDAKTREILVKIPNSKGLGFSITRQSFYGYHDNEHNQLTFAKACEMCAFVPRAAHPPCPQPNSFADQVDEIKKMYPNNCDILAEVHGDSLRVVSINGRSGLSSEPWGESSVTISYPKEMPIPVNLDNMAVQYVAEAPKDHRVVTFKGLTEANELIETIRRSIDGSRNLAAQASTDLDKLLMGLKPSAQTAIDRIISHLADRMKETTGDEMERDAVIHAVPNFVYHVAKHSYGVDISPFTGNVNNTLTYGRIAQYIYDQLNRPSNLPESETPTNLQS